MAAPKATTPHQSEAIDRELNALDIRGYTVAEIATKLDMSVRAVQYRLKKLNARAIADRAEHIAREVRTLENAIRESLDAWERSKADAVVITAEKHGKGEKVTRRTETQVALAAHMTNIIRASESRRKLLGLDAATKGVGLTITPDQLAAMSDEDVEALYARLTG